MSTREWGAVTCLVTTLLIWVGYCLPVAGATTEAAALSVVVAAIGVGGARVASAVRSLSLELPRLGCASSPLLRGSTASLSAAGRGASVASMRSGCATHDRSSTRGAAAAR